MATIQTNVGLITGMPIADTVASLMEIAARPRDALAERTNTLKDEQLAVVELSALLLSVKYVTDNLGKADLFDKRQATSSNDQLLAATVTGAPSDGTYQFTPLRTAQNQQFLSAGFADSSDPLGTGTLTFRFGDNVQRDTPLEALNGGEGIQRGKIRITDRSGASAQIDLGTARTIDDVLDAINGNTTINVTAVARGDGFQLIDNTGASVSNLKVQEVAGGTTAASLGLAGVDTASNIAEGEAIVRLGRAIDLDDLNDGNGVTLAPKSLLGDITYTLRDGTTGTIDFTPTEQDEDGGSVTAEPPTTLGEVIDAINAAAPGKLRVQIAPDGDRLVITDLTEGDGDFSLASADENGSSVVEDLGLVGEAVDGMIVGRRLLGGMNSVLLASLDGGRGVGPRGTVELTDRSGVSDTVDLSGAETLEEVIDRLNAADVGITAQINNARNGIELLDTTGQFVSNLIVANGDGETATATTLGIEIDAAVTSVNGGDLHLQVVSENTRLADFNGGAGVAAGDIILIDSKGQQTKVSLRASSSNPMETIGDVLVEINRLADGVVAELNETGDGIRLRDVAGGTGNLRVIEGSNTTAADLHLLGEVTTIDVDGEDVQVVDGSITQKVDVEEGDSLDDLIAKINAIGAGMTASTLNDGSRNPFRLSLRSDQSGEIGQLVLDTSQLGFSMQETVRGQDAMLVLGNPDSVAQSVIVSSRSNQFAGVIAGVTLDVKQASTTPVTISVSRSDADVSASVQVMVDNYNKFREHLNELTSWDETTSEGALLFGDSAALRLDSELSMLFSGQFTGAGSVLSLAELGIDIKQDGTLDYDETRLKSRFASDPEAIKTFFTTTDFGVSDRFEKAIESISGQDVSLLAQRYKSLTDKIEQNEQQIAFLDERLTNKEEQLYLQFYRMELAIGKIQNSLSVIESIQPVTPYTGNSSN